MMKTKGRGSLNFKNPSQEIWCLIGQEDEEKKAITRTPCLLTWAWVDGTAGH